MKKISDFLSKPVLNLYDCKVEGYIKNISLDKKLKKIKWVTIFDDNESQEEKVFLANDILHLGENALVIRNSDCLLIKEVVIEEQQCPINSVVYTADGKYVGKVSDILINDKNEIVNFQLAEQDKTFLPSDIVNAGEDLVILQTDSSKVKIANYKPKKQPFHTVKNIQVNILTENNTETDNIPLPDSADKKIIFNENSLPKTLTTNYGFLIGRKVEKNIYADNKEIIIKKQSKITNRTIENASVNGKLRELTMFSTTNG